MQTWVPVVNVLVAVGFGVMAIWLIMRIRSRKGPTEPLCPKCGYAVVGLTGNRCPECGNNLEVSGMVAAGGRRGELMMRWVAVWTVGILVMWSYAAYKLDVGFVRVSKEKRSVYLQIVDVQKSVQVEASGTGYGKTAPVEEIRIGIHDDRLPESGDDVDTLVWTSKARPRGDRLTEAEVVKWLRSHGVGSGNVAAEGSELRTVIGGIGRLSGVEDLRYRNRWVHAVAGDEGHNQSEVAGVMLHEFVCSSSLGGSEAGSLFTLQPWIFAGFVVVWVAGIRLLLPRRRVVVAFKAVNGR